MKEISVNKMVELMYLDYLTLPDKLKIEFRNQARYKLITYHFTLGTKIRNRFKLWKNFIRYGGEHPDTVSMLVITELWDKVNLAAIE